MATHSSVLAWRIPGTGEPGGLPSMGSHRVGHDWSDLAAAAALISCIYRWHWCQPYLNRHVPSFFMSNVLAGYMATDFISQPSLHLANFWVEVCGVLKQKRTCASMPPPPHPSWETRFRYSSGKCLGRTGHRGGSHRLRRAKMSQNPEGSSLGLLLKALSFEDSSF